MKTYINIVRALLILLIISVMPYTHAQVETEYLGIVAYEGQTTISPHSGMISSYTPVGA